MNESRETPTHRAGGTWLAGHRKAIWIGVAIAALLVVVATPAVFIASEQPAFCTSCHEMDPYYAAHAVASHKDVSCVDCHVDPGVLSHVQHKFVALQELADHFTTKPVFPQANVVVPNSRCVACHKSLPKTPTGFDHAVHTVKLDCVKCHADAGHKVSTAALAAAGILNPKALTSVTGDATLKMASTVTTATIAITGDPSRTAGHKETTCIKCHAPGTLQCSQCHTPKHAARGECTTCHSANPSPKAFAFLHPTSTACQDCHKAKHADRGACTKCHAPGTTWAFSHPAGKPDCVQCHNKPAKAHELRSNCSACHDPAVPFAKTTYAHAGSPVCSTCHDRPSGHSGRACQTCHEPGSVWKFSHPSSQTCSTCHNPPANHYGTTCGSCHKSRSTFKGASVNHNLVSSDCANCHRPPANHFGTSCSSCHRPDRKFKQAYVSHKVVNGNCSTCHARPSGHRSGQCLTCHRLKGSSWKFTHPTASSCASCHKAPGGHYGTNCASCHHKPGVTWKGAHPSSTGCGSCHKPPASHYGTNCASCHHKPGVTWAGASFNHPSIPGGQHTYRTWTCAQCHPSGPPAVNCTCHKNGTPGD
jgi:hypothetical protein